MTRHGHSALVLSEGECPHERLNDVIWRRIEFVGGLLKRELLEECASFRPDVFIQAGVRSKPIRAVLELLIARNAPLVVQCEDDEYEPFLKHGAYSDASILNVLNKPAPTVLDFIKFFSKLKKLRFLKTLANPDFDRWVDPTLRFLSYWYASAFGCIWRPMQQRMSDWFEKKTFLFPPLINKEHYEKYLNAGTEQKARLYKRYGIDMQSSVLFVSGTIYSYSREYLIFLEALKKASKRIERRITLVISGRNSLIDDLETKALIDGDFEYVNMGIPSDEDYGLMNKFAHVNVAPGISDVFNQYRMSSRLVKSLVLGKAIFTFKVGFGEDLEGSPFAFLTATDSVEEWAGLIVSALSKDDVYFGDARKFALEHFDVSSVGPKIEQSLIELIAEYRDRGPLSKLVLKTLFWCAKITGNLRRVKLYLRSVFR